MDIRLTPLALSISISLLASPLAWADGGANGNNGSILINPADFSSGAPGNESSASGGNGADLTSASTYTIEQSNNAPTAGNNGQDAPLNSNRARSAGGIGGAGGGSVFGGLSQGGAASRAGSQSSIGGAGGDIANKTINRTGSETIILYGANAGDGGSANSAVGTAGGAGGIGGAGGGSIFGGLSQGGGAGSGNSSPAANGGAGGSISSITIDLANLELNGKAGGAGGQGVISTSDGAVGAGGAGGAGGGSILGGLSQGGGAAGFSATPTTSSGGAGGSITGIAVKLSSIKLMGDVGGIGGQAASMLNNRSISSGTHGAGGNGGAGGGSVLGGLSQGGGAALSSISSGGGAGGDISNINLTLNDVILVGAQGASGGQAAFGNAANPVFTFVHGAGGSGGAGGGSIFGGLSQGGNAGIAYSSPDPSQSAEGGAGGVISRVTLRLSNVELNGQQGGSGGHAAINISLNTSNAANWNGASGAGGAGGVGGGSIFGGFSQGGGGSHTNFANGNGGTGGEVSNISMDLLNVKLTGQSGGDGGNAGISTGGSENYGIGAGGAGGAGGGSIFAGFSQGGSGGSGAGGAGGDVHSNTLSLTNVHLVGASGGAGGAGGSGSTKSGGAAGADGINGGSIFGGYTVGGAGGFAVSSDTTAANGGNGGNASSNSIVLNGTSTLTGDIYGGYSQGGNAGQTQLNGTAYSASSDITNSNAGLGGFAQNNIITLAGTNLTIAGSVYGGYSANGDGTLNNSKAFSGNTLNLASYRGSVKGIYNIEQFGWGLAADTKNGDVLIQITGSDPVQLDNTFHTITTEYDGIRYNGDERIVLIDKAQGNPTRNGVDIQEGYFLTYEGIMEVANDQLILYVVDKNPGGDEGESNPDSKTFVEGHASTAAMTQRGADLITDYGIYSAVASASAKSGNFSGFAVASGGDNRYKTGSHVDVRDINVAVGVAKGIELEDESILTLGLFMEHGQSNYDTYNRSRKNEKIHGKGDGRYTGGGVLVHYDVDGSPADSYTDDGLYLFSALRAGKTKNDFKSEYFVNNKGVNAKYDSKANYYSAVFGAGYATAIDEEQVVDVYARYTWASNSSDKVNVDNQPLKLGKVDSSRLRVGARYNYAATERVTPYIGIGYEREFEGSASASSNGVSLDQPTLRGNTGLVELGVAAEPSGVLEDWFVDASVQGYWGRREGVSGILKLGYSF